MAMLDKLQWEKRYETGHAVLDEQHQKLLSLCNDAANCVATDQRFNRVRFHLVLNDLMAYVHQHFKVEESLLNAHRTDAGIAHVRAHEGFYDQLMSIMYDTMFGQPDGERLAGLLAAWWESHVLESDIPVFRDVPQSVRQEHAGRARTIVG